LNTYNLIIKSILLGLVIAIIPYSLDHFQVLKAQMDMASSHMNMSTPTDYNSINFISYRNPNLGIQITHPVSWKPVVSITPRGHTVEFVPAVENEHQQLMPFVTLSIEKTGDDIGDLKSLTDQNLQIAKSMPEFHMINSSDIELSGTPAHKIMYTFDSPVPIPTGFQTMNIWTMKGNTVYTISYSEAKSEFVKHLPAIEKMVQSFAIAS
jgi:hypothetical protein